MSSLTGSTCDRHAPRAAIQEILRAIAAGMNATIDEAAQFLASATMLHLSPRTPDTAKVAAFLASDQARTITGTLVMSEIR